MSQFQLTQVDNAFYNDGTEAASTLISGGNITVGSTGSPDKPFATPILIRSLIQETGGKAGSETLELRVQKNGAGGYLTLASVAGINAYNSTNLTSGADTTQRLGSGTFITDNNGVGDNTTTGACSFGVGQEMNTLFCFEITAADNSNGDYYDFQVYTSGGSALTGYTETLRVTVQAPSPTVNASGYRFTSQDGTLGSPTWQAAANTNVTLPRGKTFQLWVEIEEVAGASSSYQYELTWQKNGAGGYSTLAGRPYSAAVGSMPAIYGAESFSYANDDAITSNPIAQSVQTFTNGVGVESVAESDVHSSARTLASQCTVLAFTIRIPSLYGTAGSPGTNNKNDYFDFQVRRSDGTVLNSTITARVTLGDGNGHIGGCAAETQGSKFGPFKDANGNLYYLTERSEVDNHICMMKSSDNGVNWVYQDMDSVTIDLEVVDTIQLSDTLHIFHDEGGSVRHIPYYLSNHGTTPDTFGTSTQVVASKTENDQGVAVGYRTGTADFVVFYRNGTTSEVIEYVIGTPGSWGTASTLDATNTNNYGIHVVKGADSDWLHIFYTTEETVPNTIRHRSMNPSDNSLTASEIVYSDAYDGGSGWQWAMTGAISWMSGSNDKVAVAVFDDSDNFLYFVSITDDGTPSTPVLIDNVAVNNDPGVMTSRSPVGRLTVDSNGVIYCILGDNATEDLWIYYSEDDGATWTNQTTPIEIQDNIKGEFVIAECHSLSGTEYVCYVYAANYGGYDDWVYFDTYEALSAGGTGTLNKTLANLTLSGAGTVDIDANLTKTLGALTSTAAGQVLIDANLTKTLEALTSTGAGQILVDGDLSKTLEALTLSATAGTGFPALTATLSKTLGDATASGAGQVIVDGNLNKTLEALTASGTGTVDVDSNLNKTLEALTSTTQGQVLIDGDLSKTLEVLTLSGAGTVGGFPPRSATLSKTLADLTGSASGDVIISGALTKTLDDITNNLDATVFIKGALTKDLGVLVLSSAATVQIDALLNQTLEALTLSSTGVIGDAPVTATLSKTLANLTLSSDGTVDVQATLTKTLSALTLSAAGTTLGSLVGTLNKTLDDLTASASGQVDVAGSLAKTLGALTSTTVARAIVQGVMSATLEDVTASAVSQVRIASALAKTLDDTTVTASAQVQVDGILNVTLEDVVLAGIALGQGLRSATLNQTLGALIVTATGVVVGLGNVTLSEEDLWLLSLSEDSYGITLSEE